MKNYSNLVIFYHSGTGNALKTAILICEYAGSTGLKSNFFSIDKDFKPDYTIITENTLIGFIYPTHGFNASPSMINFIAKFKSGKNDVFCMNTRAGGKFFKFITPGLSGMGLWTPAILLKLKGFSIVGLRPIDMPSNWISIHPGLPDSWINEIIAYCETKVKKSVSKILNGQNDKIRAIAEIPLDLLLFPITIGYYCFGRFFLAKTFIYDDSCNSCRLCSDNCPSMAIKMKSDKPFWTHKCESCMRCVNICPSKSVQCSHLLFFLAVIICFLPFATVLSAISSLLLFVDYDPVNSIINYSIGLALFYLLYFLVFVALRYTLVNKIFKFTSLTHYWKRYLAPGIKAKSFKNN